MAAATGKGVKVKMNYCVKCAAQVESKIPDMDNRERFCCLECDHIHYENPIPVVGILPIFEGKILLCKRAIEPKFGKWTIPSGFMELGETVEQGALREAEEEAGIQPKILGLHSMYSITRIGQVYITFLGQLHSDRVAPGIETSDTMFVTPEDIPWDELAFESVNAILEWYCEDIKLGAHRFHSNGL